MTKRTTISMPEAVYQAATRQKDQLGYQEFSDYIQALIRASTGFQPQINSTSAEALAAQAKMADSIRRRPKRK